ncbi:hypothetical protein AOG23_01765 [Rhizobium acidisoli]|nr:hypothetical protein AOG23_01765 [Rhizobium acidisoli]
MFPVACDIHRWPEGPDEGAARHSVNDDQSIPKQHRRKCLMTFFVFEGRQLMAQVVMSVSDALRRRQLAAVYPLPPSVAEFAAELTPPSVLLGLDHQRGHGSQAQGLG